VFITRLRTCIKFGGRPELKRIRIWAIPLSPGVIAQGD